MKASQLLPNKFKPLGWILLIIGLIIGLFLVATDYESELLTTKVFALFHHSFFHYELSVFTVIDNSIADELTAISIIIGGILVGFSKEKVEDEFIEKLRSDSLKWAILVNYIILFVAIVFIYDFDFLDVLVFNMFTPLLFYIFRFNLLKSRS